MMHMSSSSVLDICGGLLLIVSSIQVAATIKVHGGTPWRAIWEMTRVSLRGKKALLLVVSVLGLTDTLFPHLLSSWVPPIAPLFLFGVSLVALNGACLPPSILYLAASQRRGLTFLIEVQLAIAPLKVVHLLQSFDAELATQTAIAHSNYRVRANWQHVVRALSAISPVIIVDGSAPSAAVTEELRHIIASGLLDRTFITVDELGAIPALRDVSLPLEMNPHLVSSYHFSRALSGLGWSFLSTRARGLVPHLEDRIGRAAEAAGQFSNRSDYDGKGKQRAMEWLGNGGAGSCSLCIRRLPYVVRWEDQLTVEQRFNLESYEDVEHVYQCRKCSKHFCQKCASKARFHCRSCDSWGLRTGYVVPEE